MTTLRYWSKVYRHIADMLNEFYLIHGQNSSTELYKKLSKSAFGRKTSTLLNFEIAKDNRGLDPIQIFCTFNYSRISNNDRVENINLLLEALESNSTISKFIYETGIPSPIITRIINYRGLDTQNGIWFEFHNIFTRGYQGLSQRTFDAIPRWKGIDIPSFTMFLFWIDSEHFLPLDQNTVAFLKSYNLISARPNSYKSYVACISNIKTTYNSTGAENIFRNIVSDAYKFSDKSYQGELISGSTASVISYTVQDQVSTEQIENEALKKRKELFKNFEIIAIRPKERVPEGKKQRHLKNLIEGELYQFYGAYIFTPHDDKIITYDNSNEINIFNKKELNISISAVVGKNGSGKSTLVELIYLIINKVAYAKHIKSTEKLIDEEVFADLFIKSDKLYRISVGENVEVFEYIFEEETNIYRQLTKEDQGQEAFKKFDIENFCYSLAINYSLYSLNSKIIGNWINPLFHKNDSYQVPIVLNPKRDEGVINVNIEDSLAKSRLLANVLEPALNDLKNGQSPALVPGSTPQKLVFELDNEKFERKQYLYRERNKKKILKHDIKKVMEAYNLPIHSDVEFIDKAEEYIYLKTISIAHNYPKFRYYKALPKWIDDKERVKEYVDLLKQETSHITFKLRQAINYLLHGIYNSKNENSILQLSSEIDRLQKTDSSHEYLRTIDLIPPPFLKSNVVFEHGGDFNALSSGEKQQIYSINTILYHLYNIQSVMVYKDVYKYNCVNIIFDEVELYFHPEMQRTFVNNLLKRLEQLTSSGATDINNINVIFVTHSPFILSDIPKANVLMLDVDKDGRSKPERPLKNTFAANVHELLADSFFLSSSIGEYAKEQINGIISFYNKVKNAKTTKQLKSLKRVYLTRITLFAQITENIGEDFIQGLIKNHIAFIEEKLNDL
ncbi:MAG: AAA family ATPase [Flavipsychrobacter sp.]|nr:AAA family ATPase [Flavipsychrobacter sp.]